MSFHFISILGAGSYQATYYDDDNEAEVYVQAALIKKFLSRIDNDAKITIFYTLDLMKDNRIQALGSGTLNYDEWMYQNINDEEKDNIFVRGSAAIKSVESKNSQIMRENDNSLYSEGLHNRIYRLLPNNLKKDKIINGIPIKDGKKPNEMMDIFSVMFDQIRDDDEIIFDVTHGFRSIPILSLSILNFAKVIKNNVQIDGIYYGAYEARENEKTPLFNLLPFNRLIEWSFAANTFMKYGDSGELYHLSKNDTNETVRKMMRDLYSMTQCLETSRGKYSGTITANNDARYKAGYADTSYIFAYEQFKKNEEQFNNQFQNNAVVGNLNAPLKKMIDKINDKIDKFDIPNNDSMKSVKQGIAAVIWAVENNRIQQGYTALDETIKTYLCVKFNIDIDDSDMREVVKSLCYSKLKNNNKDDAIDEAVAFIRDSTYREACKNKINNTKKYEKIIADKIIDKKFVYLMKKISDCRNSLNHFGYERKSNGYTSNDFAKELNDDLNAFLEILSQEV